MTPTRETIVIEVADHKFEIKTYATARETHNIQKAYFEGSKVEIVGDSPKITDFDASVQFKVQLAMINEMVVAMDDTKENIVERCENLRDSVFQELATKIDEQIAKKN